MEKLYPIIFKKLKLKLIVIGKYPKRLEKLNKFKNFVVFKGYVKDIRNFFHKKSILISPIQFGSGIKIKIINSLFENIFILGNKLAFEGLKVRKKFIMKNNKDYLNNIELIIKSNTHRKILLNAQKEILKESFKKTSNFLEN